MQAKYLMRRQGDLKMLQSALQDDQFDPFTRLGHQIKGNASSYGYIDLQEIAERIEIAGLDMNRESAQQIVAEFKSWLDCELSSML